MKTEPLALEHKELIQSRFRSLGLCLSEYSFASRYLFRREYEFQVGFDEEMVWIIGKTSDGMRYFMPTEDLQKIQMERLLAILEETDCFYPIPEYWISAFNPSHFHMSYDRNDSDYLFKKAKIAEYPGRNLSPKRNLVKQFFDIYQAEVVPYTKKHLEDALTVLKAWQSSFKGEKTDFLPCQDGLMLTEELGLSGYIVYVDKQPAAFILGEILLPKLFDIHFAKALTQYKGIYPFLFKELAKHLPSEEICCLNWEQDLGHNGLRQSKLSYQPYKIAHKYRVFAKK
jgi:uncharacterized protein